MEESSKGEQSKQPGNTHSVPILSSVLRDGRMVELLYKPDERSTQLAVWDGQQCQLATSVRMSNGSEGLTRIGVEELTTL